MPAKNTGRLMLVAATGLVAIAVAAAAYLAVSETADDLPGSPNMLALGGTPIGGPFELTDQTGARVTEAEVIDRPALLYFGYTYCPDVCPTDVQTMADAAILLEERGVEVRPVFVTVDPARDTPGELAYYAEAMHPRMMALTGSAEDIRAAADAYKVFYQKVGEGDKDYLLSHSNYHYLAVPGRGTVAVFRPKTPADAMAEDVIRVLDAIGTAPAG